MPEVKWVDSKYLVPKTQPHLYAMDGRRLTECLPLDDLEAWLMDRRDRYARLEPMPLANRHAKGVYDDLLAQVRGWKATIR